MNNWEKYKLGEAVDFKNGKLISFRNERGSCPIYGGNGIVGYSDDFNSKNETLIIGRVGAYCGNVFYSKENCWVTDNAILGKVKNENNTRYFFYLLSFLELNNFRGGSSQPLLNQGTLNGIDIEIPEPQLQTRIASILSSLDDKIELNRRTNQTLEQIAQTLFKKYFVDDIDPENLPEGWRWGKLEEMYKTTSGGTPSRVKMEYYEDGNICWVKSKELDGGFILDTEEKITKDALKNSSAKLLPAHSVLVAMYGATVGEIAVLSMEATCNQAICAILPNDDYPYSFILQFLKLNKEELINRASGSAQQNISQLVIQNFELSIPPVHLAKEFHKVAGDLFLKIESNLKENKHLMKIRDSLLPKLMSGEIEVNSAEKELAQL